MNVFFPKGWEPHQGLLLQNGFWVFKTSYIRLYFTNRESCLGPCFTSATPSSVAAFPLQNPWLCPIVGMPQSLHLEPTLLSYKWWSSGILCGILNSCLCLGKIRHLGDIGPTFSSDHQGEAIGGHNPFQGWKIARRFQSSLTPFWSHMMRGHEDISHLKGKLENGREQMWLQVEPSQRVTKYMLPPSPPHTPPPRNICRSWRDGKSRKGQRLYPRVAQGPNQETRHEAETTQRRKWQQRKYQT